MWSKTVPQIVSLGWNMPKSQLYRIQLDLDKLTIRMSDDGDHPDDVLLEKAMMVQKRNIEEEEEEEQNQTWMN